MNTDLINIINDRLILVEHLNKAEQHFKGRLYRREPNPYEVEYPLYKNYHGLKIYLLLTCFDILGQPDEWLDFNSWLNCKKTNIIIERNSIYEKLSFCDPSKYINAVQEEYNKIYGVKNSFFSFVNKSISKENRIKLFNSIENIEQISERKVYENGSHSGPSGRSIEIDDDLKLKFLFQLRNSFTHKGVAYGNTGGAVFDINIAHEIRDGKPIHYSYDIHKEKLNGKVIIWKVRQWPFILSEIITDTLKELIEKK